FQLALAYGRELDKAFDQLESRFTEEGGPGIGSGLDPGGDIHRVAQSAICQGLVLADLTDDCGAGVNAGPKLRSHSVLRFDFGPEVIDPGLDVSRRPTGSQRSVLECNGRSKYRHEAIAGEVLEHAAVSLDSLRLFADDPTDHVEDRFLAELFGQRCE